MGRRCTIMTICIRAPKDKNPFADIWEKSDFVFSVQAFRDDSFTDVRCLAWTTAR